MLFFQSAIDSAKEEYEGDNENAQALTRWGGALIEMAHLHRGEESASLIEEGIAKLQKAMELDPNRHDALWCLGNAYTSKGFLANGDKALAQEFFDKALESFIKAKDLDPTNEIYSRAIEVTHKAPEIYDEIQRQLGIGPELTDEGLPLMDDGPSMCGMEDFQIPGRSKKSPKTDFWWDAAGWVCLVAIGFALLTMSQKASVSK